MNKSGYLGLKMGLAGMILVGLSGCASFLAQSTGPAPLGTDSGVRTFSQVLNDNSIERTAKINTYKLDERFKYARINIASFHSAVLLTGQVGDQYLKQLAEDNVRAMSDVKTVHNYITIGEKIPYNTIVQDSIVTANIRRMLVTSPDISDTKVKVQTEDGVVYVMGKLTPSENQALINILQSTPNIVKVVSLIDLLSDAGVATSSNGLTQSATPATASTLNTNLTRTASTTPLASPTTTIDQTPVAIDPEQAAPDQTDETSAP
ncbi:BON domain-containing protein [Alkanindiges illinoisensis]|uniref:BON domain-containing protein n=1 Tax=Alkanindiges illinoisensis TaxID=197183 RepID=UPI00068635F9